MMINAAMKHRRHAASEAMHNKNDEENDFWWSLLPNDIQKEVLSIIDQRAPSSSSSGFKETEPVLLKEPSLKINTPFNDIQSTPRLANLPTFLQQPSTGEKPLMKGIASTPRLSLIETPSKGATTVKTPGSFHLSHLFEETQTLETPLPEVNGTPTQVKYYSSVSDSQCFHSDIAVNLHHEWSQKLETPSQHVQRGLINPTDRSPVVKQQISPQNGSAVLNPSTLPNTSTESVQAMLKAIKEKSVSLSEGSGNSLTLREPSVKQLSSSSESLNQKVQEDLLPFFSHFNGSQILSEILEESHAALGSSPCELSDGFLDAIEETTHAITQRFLPPQTKTHDGIDNNDTRKLPSKDCRTEKQMENSWHHVHQVSHEKEKDMELQSPPKALFQTARGKPLAPLSKAALIKAKAMLETDVNQDVNQDAKLIENGNSTLCFQTASKSIMNSEYKLKQNVIESENLDPKTRCNLTSSFVAASGTPLKPISSEAFKRAQHLCDDMGAPLQKNVTGDPDMRHVKDKHAFTENTFKRDYGIKKTQGNQLISMFQTASGKALKDPNPEAFAKAAAMLDTHTKDEVPSVSMFQTASGKALKDPNPESFAKAAAILDKQTKDEVPSVSMFQTASGKALKDPNPEAFAKAAAMLDIQTKDEVPSVSMFQTASGKALKDPNPEAFAKAAAMLDIHTKDEVPSVSMYQTALLKPTDTFDIASGTWMKSPSKDHVKEATISEENMNVCQSGEPLEVRRTKANGDVYTGSASSTSRNPSEFKNHKQVHTSSEDFVKPKDDRRKIQPTYNGSKRPRDYKGQDFRENVAQTGNTSSACHVTVGLKDPASKRRASEPIFNDGFKRKSKRFSTPFKFGLPVTPSTPINTNKKQVRLFDLTGNSSRKSLLEFVGDEVLTTSVDELDSLNIPHEIINLDYGRSAGYEFNIGSSSWNYSDAYKELIAGGANTDLINESWTQNHYQLIVWKLASYVRRFPKTFWIQMEPIFTPKEVLRQLKFRYEKEINEGHRSIIKACCEKDDSPATGLLLVVCEILRGTNGSLNKIVLSDGWYKIPAKLDNILSTAVDKRKIYSGQKLYVYGAQLMNLQNAAPPLEIGSDVCLSICANGTRIAHLASSLGKRREDAHALTLRSISPGGGIIPSLRLFISKVYCLVYVETNRNGSKTYRNFKEEEHAQAAYLSTRDLKFQVILERMMKQNDSVDPTVLRDQALLEVEEQICERKVTKYLKLKGYDHTSECPAVITLWRPGENAIVSLKPGKSYKFYGLNSGPKGQFSTLSGSGSNIKFVETPTYFDTSHIPTRSWCKLDALKQMATQEDIDCVGIIITEDGSFCFIGDQSGDLAGIQNLNNKISRQKIGEIIAFRDLRFSMYDASNDISTLIFVPETEMRWLPYNSQSIDIFENLKKWKDKQIDEYIALKSKTDVLMGYKATIIS